MNENYILLPSEVKYELNYVLPDPSITIELIAKLLENTGWQNKSQKPYIFQNTVNYFDTKEHSIYTNKESFDRSNFVKFLTEQEKNDDFLYSGSSASSYIMSPIMFEHSSDKIMQRLDSNTHSAPLKGLGYLDYAYIPHYPFLPPFECLSEIARTFEKQNLPHKTFKDGEVLVKDTITKNEVIYGK